MVIFGPNGCGKTHLLEGIWTAARRQQAGGRVILLTAEQFTRYFELMGVQRHLKAAGIFARLNHRDGKPAYLEDVPRTLSYIVDLKGRYAELEFLIDLVEQRVLPGMEANS